MRGDGADGARAQAHSRPVRSARSHAPDRTWSTRGTSTDSRTPPGCELDAAQHQNIVVRAAGERVVARVPPRGRVKLSVCCASGPNGGGPACCSAQKEEGTGKVNRLFCNVSSQFVIKEEVFIHKKYLLTRLPDGRASRSICTEICMHFAFILLNLESQDLRKYFQYICPVHRGRI